ncbi:MAG: efflux transporter periplasmic adaptor subunit, partial [Gammaproteobacteria bacterium]
VDVGAKINRLQLISSGLQPGESVVLEGVQKLKNGMTIKPLPSTFEEIAKPSPAQHSGV